jgi:hypothetical protein
MARAIRGIATDAQSPPSLVGSGGALVLDALMLGMEVVGMK